MSLCTCLSRLIALIVVFYAASLFGDDWIGEDYENNSDSQFQDANYLLSKVCRDYEPGDSLRILDVGCGDGKITSHISSVFWGSAVVGIDLSPSMVRVARENHSSLGLSLFCPLSRIIP